MYISRLTHRELLSEANLAADLVRLASNPGDQAQAEALLDNLLLEISRREEAVIAVIPHGLPLSQAMELVWGYLS